MGDQIYCRISRTGTYNSILFGSITDPSVDIGSVSVKLTGKDAVLTVPRGRNPATVTSYQPLSIIVPMKQITIGLVIDGYLFDSSGSGGDSAETKRSKLWNIFESGEMCQLKWRNVSINNIGTSESANTNFKITDCNIMDTARDSEPTRFTTSSPDDIHAIAKYRVNLTGVIGKKRNT